MALLFLGDPVFGAFRVLALPLVHVGIGNALAGLRAAGRRALSAPPVATPWVHAASAIAPRAAQAIPSSTFRILICMVVLLHSQKLGRFGFGGTASLPQLAVYFLATVTGFRFQKL